MNNLGLEIKLTFCLKDTIHIVFFTYGRESTEVSAAEPA